MVKYRVLLWTGKWTGYVDRDVESQASFTEKAVECLPNRLTPVYSKNHYEEENYLKVKIVIFKYITPPYSNSLVRWYIGMLVFWVHHILMFLCSELLYVLSYLCNSATPYPIVLLVLLVLYFVYWLCYAVKYRVLL